MAAQSYSIKINSIIVTKFSALTSGIPAVPDKLTSINILPQVHEVSIYESIWNPVMKCEIAVVDFIGLFTNFPLTGEEIITIEYSNVGDAGDQAAQLNSGDDAINKTKRTWTFAIEKISDISVKDDNRATSYVITCMHIEGLANVLGTVMQGYRGSPIEISKNIFEDHIVQRVKQFYPSYQSPNIFTEDNSLGSYVITVPNMHPIAAIDMVNDLTYTQVMNRYTYVFYQTNDGFNFRTLQGLIDRPNAKRRAFQNKYKYFSDEIAEVNSKMQNETRVVSKLAFNKRHSTMQKVAAGYFNNNLFELNIAQKAIHTTRTKIDDPNILTLEDNKLNTEEYSKWAMNFDEGYEQSNRTRYVISSRAENDPDFIVPMTRQRWGKDLISKVALAQIDITCVIPGTNRFVAGDLFYLEIPEFHGFEELKKDDLISGYYMITEIKHIVSIGGYQTTVLRLNRDSFNSSIDRPSKYGK